MTNIAVFDRSDWRLRRDVLLEALARDWPETEVTRAAPGAAGAEARDVEWQSGTVEGWAHADGRCICLDGPIDSVADFVVWYRRLVPATEDVIFCDDSYSFDGMVLPDATRDDVLRIAS